MLWLQLIASVLWYFLPAIAANMAPVIIAWRNWWPALNQPLDGGWRLGSQRILGDNKTIRGLLGGLFVGVIVALLQALITHRSVAWAIAWGLLLSIGALGGDSLKSFIKRRLRIPPGARWWPWDQLDVVLGVFVVSAWVAALSWLEWLVAVVVIGGGTLVINWVSVRLNIKQAL